MVLIGSASKRIYGSLLTITLKQKLLMKIYLKNIKMDTKNN
jgi:hypothetical protein